MSLPKQMNFNWRKPDEPNGPVHSLIVTGIRVEGWGVLGGNGRTLCGYEPVKRVVITSTTDDVNCEPCLTAIGGDAVDMVERLLAELREPVAA